MKQADSYDTAIRILIRIDNMLTIRAPLPMIENEVRILANYLKTLRTNKKAPEK